MTPPRRASVLLLLAALATGCAAAAPQAIYPQLEDHQRLANALRHRVRVHGGRAPEDHLGVVQTMPFWRSGFGGLNIWLCGVMFGAAQRKPCKRIFLLRGNRPRHNRLEPARNTGSCASLVREASSKSD